MLFLYINFLGGLVNPFNLKILVFSAQEMAFIMPPESISYDSYLFAHALNLFTLVGNLSTFLNNQIIYQTIFQNQLISLLP